MTDLISGLQSAKLEAYNLPYDLTISTATITCRLKNVIFNVNNKPFVKDYKIALAKYNNFNKNTDDKIIEKAIENNDIGILSDINEIISYKNLLELKDRFIIE
jgi:hypothetical protein